MHRENKLPCAKSFLSIRRCPPTARHVQKYQSAECGGDTKMLPLRNLARQVFPGNVQNPWYCCDSTGECRSQLEHLQLAGGRVIFHRPGTVTPMKTCVVIDRVALDCEWTMGISSHLYSISVDLGRFRGSCWHCSIYAVVN